MKYLASMMMAAFVLGVSARAGDWPMFRGPGGSGVSDEKGLPVTWNDKENVRWKVATPGRSVASPIVVGDKVFLTSSSGVRADRLHVQCIHADTGKVLWHRQLAATGNTGHHPKSAMAAPSPCANGDTVFCLFATADMAAFDFDGNLLWYRSLAADYPDIANQVGMASSPIVHKDIVVIPMDTAGDSFLAAVDTKYGKNVWKVKRPREINWVTPTLRKVGDKAEVVFAARTKTIAYNVEDGTESWSIPVGAADIATVQTVGDKLLLPSRGGLALYEPKQPNSTEMKEAWKSAKLAAGSSTPVVVGGRVYSLRAPSLTCGDLKTGKDLWQERVGKGKGQFWASPIAGDGKVYVFDDAGICTVLAETADKNEILATNDIRAEIMGTPAIARGSLYIRTVDALWCISTKK